MDTPNQSGDTRRREQQGLRLAIVIVIIAILALTGWWAWGAAIGDPAAFDAAPL